MYERLVGTSRPRIVDNGGKKGATLSDGSASPSHSRESAARGGKVSRAGATS